MALLAAGPVRAQSAGDVERFLASRKQDADVAAFYHQRGNRPAWFDSGRPTHALAQLEDAISRVDEYGLPTSSYPLPTGPPDAYAEVMVTTTALRLARHLLHGRVDPEKVYYGWTLPHRHLDLPAKLNAAVGQDTVGSLYLSFEPPYAGYERLKRALRTYRRIADGGGWPIVPTSSVLRQGDTLDAIVALRRRLAVEGDLHAAGASNNAIFDSAVDLAVRSFQERHGLEIDGIVGRETFAELNVPVEGRIEQIELNMERWRWLPADLGASYAHVNIAGYRLDILVHGRSVLRMKVIIGTPRTRTPVFSTRIAEVVLAPYWYVPRSIAVNEILPKLERDPNYLRRNRIARLPGGTLRQDPGPANPLGSIKFTIPNGFGVGLHDTPERHLFEHSARAYSHGCMRLEHPLELALYLLQGTTWTRENIESVIDTWRSLTIRIETPLPLHVLYWTAEMHEEGRIHFYNDVYGYDEGLERAIEGR